MAVTWLIGELERRFTSFDPDNSGYIELAKLEARSQLLSKAYGLQQDSSKAKAALAGIRHLWENLVKLAGTDTAGQISKEEFLSSIGKALEDDAEGTFDGVIAPAFAPAIALLDTNDDGILNTEEVTRYFQLSGFPKEESEEIFNALDADSDGKVSIDEFMAGSKAFWTTVDSDLPG